MDIRLGDRGTVDDEQSLSGGGAALAQTQLLIYTAIEPEELEPIRKAFRAEHPDIDIKWVRASTGIITAKILAEINAGNTPADIFLA